MTLDEMKTAALGHESLLAPHAARASGSRGRLVDEPPSATRTAFQRDRDRIIHSAAFRRLKHKTQVFVYHEGDHYRTRLTHSLEVAQIARSMARILRLNEDLAETLALAHDLGHPPFGHAGERALNEAMAPYGGFDHNAQTIRLVTGLERRYPDFDGLNLTWETLEGLAKHNGPLVAAPDDEDGFAALPFGLRAYNRRQDLELFSFASAEAQLAAIADDVAYNNHDIDDGLRAGLFTLDGLARAVPMAWRVLDAIDTDHAGLSPALRGQELVRRLIGLMVHDILTESGGRIEALAPATADDIRAAAHPVIAFSDPVLRDVNDLRQFLYAHMYRNRLVTRTTSKARRLVLQLFDLYMDEPDLLPDEWMARAAAAGSPETARAVADFIGGMTDRYAVREYRKLFEMTAFTL